jgi:hypothetical protein
MQFFQIRLELFFLIYNNINNFFINKYIYIYEPNIQTFFNLVKNIQ